MRLFEQSEGGLAVTGGLKDGIVNIFDLRTHKPVGSVRAHSSCVTSIQSITGGVVSTGTDSLISVFRQYVLFSFFIKFIICFLTEKGGLAESFED